ncbi:MAG: stage II sporulation protein M [Hyphomonadaceae bacterium]
MSEMDLRSRRFRQEREADWRRLEVLLRRAEGARRNLTIEDMVAIPRLYRATLSSLAVARATSLDRALIDYLEALSSRAYFFVYGARSTLWERLRGFFSGGWPRAVQALWRETLIAALLLIGGAIAAYLLVNVDSDWYYSFVPGDLLQGRTPAATREALRATLYTEEGSRAGLSVFATFLFTHNARVALFAFALGFAFGAPTAMLLVYTGLMLGAFIALYASHGLAFELIGWLMIHGVTELFAIVLAGAAGFKIGFALAFPGAMTRIDAAAAAGRIAAAVMGGVIVMLFVAGVLEGVGRQAINADAVRYAIAVMTGVFWFGYFYAPIWGRTR